MSLIIPPFIKQNASFGLVSPAGKIEPDVVRNADKFLKKQGFNTKHGNHVSDEYFRFSGQDADRTRDLQEMLDDPETDVIWCCRGGYGSIRIIEHLNFSKIKENPKWLIGFSDITVLHAALQNVVGMASIHGPMPCGLSKNNKGSDFEHTISLLKGDKIAINARPNPFNRTGSANGILIGGNLSLLVSLSGTKYDFNSQGKILFIEEVGEHLYHIDRMMHNLKLSGKLHNLSALIVGQFTELKDNHTPFGQSAYEIIAEAVKDYKYPVVYDFPAGHTTPNEPLMMGREAVIEVNEKGGFFSYSIVR